MTEVVLLGGGGHAAVCLDVFVSAGARVRGYVDRQADERLPATYLGTDDALRDHGDCAVFVAIGDNRRRCALVDECRSQGFAIATAISPSAVMSPSVTVGVGTLVMPGSIINARTRLGVGVIVNTGATVDHDCDLGDFVHVAPGTHLAGSVILGEGCMLGVGACVIPGRTVGAWTTVGAGATVVDDLAAGVVAVGTPARPR